MIDFSAQSLTRMKSRGWGGLCSHLEARLRKNLIPDLLTFLAESCSLGWGSCLPAIDKKLLSTPVHCSHSLTQWPLLSSKPAVKNCLYIKSLTLWISPGAAQSLFNVLPDYIWHIDNNQSQLIRNLDFCFSLSFFFFLMLGISLFESESKFRFTDFH